jgi:molybdenum cofactor biosynthesis enzyme MoaA
MMDARIDVGDAERVLAEAMRAADRRDIYWSNELLYRWLATAKHPTYPRRLAYLRRLARSGSIPGAAVAFARVLAKRGDLNSALKVADAGLADARKLPGTLQLHVIENQITALRWTLAGKRVPRALARYLGDDDGYLFGRTCHVPFERVDIQDNGNCVVCCSQWMTGFSLGNVFDGNSASELFNNDQAVAARRSMLDGSFKFCDLVKCPKISGDNLPTKQHQFPEWQHNTRQALDRGELRFDGPSVVYLILDISCNLTCPSCRTHLITEKLELQLRKEALIETSIMPLLRGAYRVHVNSGGEWLVSRPLRRLLSRLSKAEFPNLHLSIISNGTLFNEREWSKFQGLHDLTDSIRISTDAARKETFEKLRRGAKWEPFVDNLAFLAGLRAKGAIKEFILSFTFQVDNFREMPAFVEMARELHPDTIVQFEKLGNWGTFTAEEYQAKAVHHMDHPLHEEFLSIIRRPEMRQERPNLRAEYMALL